MTQCMFLSGKVVNFDARKFQETILANHTSSNTVFTIFQIHHLAFVFASHEIMLGPIFVGPVESGNDCSPFFNCTQRNAFINFVEHKGMQCAHAPENSYAVLCRSIYNHHVVEGASSQEQIFWVVILVCVVVIVCLSLNTARLTTKLNEHQHRLNRENSHNSNHGELKEVAHE